MTHEQIDTAIAVAGTLLAILAVIASMVLQPCQIEDATNCYWDAQTQGNGQGQSFITVGDATLYLN